MPQGGPGGIWGMLSALVFPEAYLESQKKCRQLHTLATSMSKTQWQFKTFEANVQKLNEKSRLWTNYRPESGVCIQISWSLLRKSKKRVDGYTLETGILIRLHEISMILCFTFAPMEYWAPSPNPHFCPRYSIRDELEVYFGPTRSPGASWGLRGPPGVSWGLRGFLMCRSRSRSCCIKRGFKYGTHPFCLRNSLRHKIIILINK